MITLKDLSGVATKLRSCSGSPSTSSRSASAPSSTTPSLPGQGLRSAADLGGPGEYDLVTIFEALHDMSRLVEALNAARQILTEDGTLLMVDGLVAEEFPVPASPRERTEYGWSVVSCLPAPWQTRGPRPPELSCLPRCFVTTPSRRASAWWRFSRYIPTTGAFTDCCDEGDPSPSHDGSVWTDHSGALIPPGG
jgi:hypothetical protein